MLAFSGLPLDLQSTNYGNLVFIYFLTISKNTGSFLPGLSSFKCEDYVTFTRILKLGLIHNLKRDFN